MHVVILGASGFVGKKLALQLVKDPKLDSKPIDELTLADVIQPEIPSSCELINTIRTLQTDLTNPHCIQEILEKGKTLPDVIFHLAAIVSGDAEQNFELGYTVNVDATRCLLDAIKTLHEEHETYKPRLVFTSSLAVYGTPLPDIIPDDYQTTPRGSYGTQKAIAELYLEDYTRKGFVDGVSIRFPTIAIRPGKPNKAASSFISGIVREPLNRIEAPLPVSMDFRHTVASPRAAVGYLLRAAVYEPEVPGDRVLQMPGVSLTVEDMIKALEDVAGPSVTQLIKPRPDDFIIGIVKSWPTNFASKNALRLGFQPDKSYTDILKAYIEDEGIQLKDHQNMPHYKPWEDFTKSHPFEEGGDIDGGLYKTLDPWMNPEWDQSGVVEKVVDVEQEPRHDISFVNEYTKLMTIKMPPGDTTIAHRHEKDTIIFVLMEDGTIFHDDRVVCFLGIFVFISAGN